VEEQYCPFCDKKNYEFEGDLVFTKTDSYPVSKGHTLVIPKRHVSDYFDCTESEVAELWALVDKTKNRLQNIYAPDGFNIGINVGEAAGQTVPHMHIHVIPRYSGDMDDPRGGVRGVIPNKQKY